MTAVATHRWPLLSSPAVAAACLACILLLPAARADAPAQNETVFILNTVAGDEHRGSLRELRDPWTVRLESKGLVRRDAEEWISLRRAGRTLPPCPAGPHLIFSNGDRLAISGDEVTIANDSLLFRHAVLGDGKETKLGLSAVAAVWLADPDTATDPEVFCRRLATDRPRRDVILLRNGDSLEGVLMGFGKQGVQARIGQRPTDVARAKIAAISLSNLAEAKPRMPDVFARLTLADGSRLTVGQATCADRENLSGMTLSGTPFRIPLNDLVALDLYHSHVVYLSDLKPAKYEHTPYLGAAWPLGIDGTLRGGSLRLGGSVFDRGIAMHSASRATYALPQGAKRFEARVGLDDRLGIRGSVRVRVLVDGKEREFGMRDELTQRGGPAVVRVDLAGAKELTLVVDFGANGDVGDHVNWVDARVLR